MSRFALWRNGFASEEPPLAGYVHECLWATANTAIAERRRANVALRAMAEQVRLGRTSLGGLRPRMSLGDGEHRHSGAEACECRASRYGGTGSPRKNLPWRVTSTNVFGRRRTPP